MEGPNKADDVPDDWWWLAVTTPDGVHLYELGYPRDVDGVRVVLDDARHAQILEVLGVTWSVFEDPFGGWRQEMAPGRPNQHLEPREYTPDGTLLPIRPKPGVTLHLLDV